MKVETNKEYFERNGKVLNEQIIETPDLTVARYVYTDHVGNRIYYDGLSYWVVDHKTNLIDYYN